jgi:WD40-like Beta Propeller Repeat
MRGPSREPYVRLMSPTSLFARSRIRAIICALAIVAGACTTAGASVSGSGPPPSSVLTWPAVRISIKSLEGKILFTRAGGRFGDETVFTMNADGTREERITDFGATCCPRWSPDGEHILISGLSDDDRITTEIVAPDGTHERSIPLPPGELNLGCTQAWSPATGRLACEGGWDPGLLGVYTLRASDGTDLVRVTRCSSVQNDRPLGISPDGTQIYFMRGTANPFQGSLFSVATGGGRIRRVTPPSLLVDVVGNAGGRLSTDGRWIVFTSSGVIYAIHPDGSELTKLFEDHEGRLAITPTWSPDGRFILFGLDPSGSIPSTDHPPANGLFVIRADGSDLTPLLISDDWKREPDWVA